MKYLVLDTETNGIGTFNPPTQRAVQVSWIREDGTEHDYLLKGVKKISTQPSYPCKHITVEKLDKEGVTFAEAWSHLRKDIKEVDVIVIHNAQFDMGILYREMRIAKLPNLKTEWNLLRSKKVCCTMNKSENYCALPKNGSASRYSGYKWPRLEELYKKLFNNNLDDSLTLHNSLDDCRVLKMCYEEGCVKGIF